MHQEQTRRLFALSYLSWKGYKHYLSWVCVCRFSYHALRMRRIIFSSVVCPVVPCLSALSHKRQDFGKKLLNMKYAYWLSLQILSQIFLLLWRTQRYIIINVHRPSCKVLWFLSDFKLEFFRQISPKLLKYKMLWKSVQWEPICAMRTDGRTDITKLSGLC
jgi:hypothetical protein